MKRTFLAIILFIVGILDVAAQRDYGTWSASSQTYVNKTYHLQWDLSELGEWRVASNEILPKEHIFAAAMVDDYVSVTLQLSEEKQNVGSIWLNAEAFIKGMEQRLKGTAQSSGISYGKIKYKKCRFLLREALLFEMDATVYDARLGEFSPLKCILKGYAFSKGKEIIVAKVMFPKSYQEEYGEVMSQLFFGGFGYYDNKR